MCRKKRVIIYGAGGNCDVFFKFANLDKIDIIAIADKNKAGEKYGNGYIVSPDLIFRLEFDEVYLLIAENELIIKYLVDGLGIEKARIRTVYELNQQFILCNIDSHRYIMLTDTQDYSNYPYEELNNRSDFAMVGTMFQANRWGISFDKKQGEHIFIVRDHCWPRYKQEGLINYLKNRYIASKFVLLMSDMCDGAFGRKATYGEDYLINAKAEFDVVITYHSKEAAKYGISHKEQTFPRNPRIGQEQYDVFFIGHAKNRLDILHNTYLWLTLHGVTCRFWITNVDEKKQLKCDGIIYNRRLEYEDILTEISKCRCILEVCQEADETTYRYAEAVTNNKKFLVNDLSCKDRKYFMTEYMRYFKLPEDIDCEWIKNDHVVDYHYADDFSPEKFLEYIEQKIK